MEFMSDLITGTAEYNELLDSIKRTLTSGQLRAARAVNNILIQTYWQIGKEIVLLYFYPKDDTKGCTAEACSLRDKMIDFKQRGVAVVGVSFDNAESHQRFAFKYNLNFPLLADTHGKIADAYGVRMGGDKKMDRRVSFLIGLDGKIIHVTDSPDPDVHVKELATAMSKLGGKVSP